METGSLTAPQGAPANTGNTRAASSFVGGGWPAEPGRVTIRLRHPANPLPAALHLNRCFEARRARIKKNFRHRESCFRE